MKKITIIAILFFFCFRSLAQLPAGSIAPDFTITDLSGNQHTLSTYLAQGKIVIMEWAGTHCHAAWKMHSSGEMQDFYNAYGPAGSNEIITLMIDSNVSMETLMGSDNPPAFGNWMQNTYYPVCAVSSYPSTTPTLYEQYQVNWVPTVYEIYPDQSFTYSNFPTALSLRTQASVHNQTLVGVSNYVKLSDNQNAFCGNTGSFETQLKNYGNNFVTTATLNLRENGNIIATKTFDVNQFQFYSATLQFDPITVNPSSLYSAEVVSVNGVPNYNNQFSTAAMPFYIAGEGQTNLLVKVHTYGRCDRMSWKLTSSGGSVIATGGPYPVGTGTSYSVLEQNVTLPDTNDCYSLTLIASDGLGWKDYYAYAPDPANAGIEIFKNGTLIFSRMNVENFGTELQLNDVISVQKIEPEEPEPTNISVYPNPSSGSININSDSFVSVEIFDLMGKRVYQSDHIDKHTPIDLSQLGSSIYIVKIIGTDDKVTISKLLLN
jgi:hypothetical protein